MRDEIDVSFAALLKIYEKRHLLKRIKLIILMIFFANLVKKSAQKGEN